MAAAALAAAPLAATNRADRSVAWVRADGGLERGLNANGARGLRLAAVSDGLPCSVAVMQAPDGRPEPTEYRVVLDRDLAAALPGLVDDGFVPRASARTTGTRHQVVFERTATRAPALDWQVVTFDKLDDLAAALAPAAAEGYRARLLVRVPFRSWPGLSEAGMVCWSRATAVRGHVLARARLHEARPGRRRGRVRRRGRRRLAARCRVLEFARRRRQRPARASSWCCRGLATEPAARRP